MAAWVEAGMGLTADGHQAPSGGGGGDAPTLDCGDDRAVGDVLDISAHLTRVKSVCVSYL